jgi:hypothetical protein
MTENQPPADPASPEDNSEDLPSIPPDPALSGLLRRALPESESQVDLLQSVQRKLRERSGGKFYEEGWSLSKHPPISMYLITSLFMIAILVVLYSVLFSFSGTPENTTIEPPPVQVMPPR